VIECKRCFDPIPVDIALKGSHPRTVEARCFALAFQATPFAQLSRLARACERTNVTRRVWGADAFALGRGKSAALTSKCAHANNRGYASPCHARLRLHNTTCALYWSRIVPFEELFCIRKSPLTSTQNNSKMDDLKALQVQLHSTGMSNAHTKSHP